MMGVKMLYVPGLSVWGISFLSEKLKGENKKKIEEEK